MDYGEKSFIIQSFLISKGIHFKFLAVWRHRTSHTGEFATDVTSLHHCASVLDFYQNMLILAVT